MYLVRSFLRDARHAQIAVLFVLILLGITVFDFNIPIWHVLGVLGATLATVSYTHLTLPTKA